MMSTATLPSLSARDDLLSRLKLPDGLMKRHCWLIEGSLTPSMNVLHSADLWSLTIGSSVVPWSVASSCKVSF